MKSAEVQAIHQSLLEQKSAILNKAHEFRQGQAERTPMADEADAASLDLSNNISIHLQERDRRTLYQIERALGKISDGTYGECEGCGGDIGPRRLQVHPFTTLCVSCMEEAEAPRFQ